MCLPERSKPAIILATLMLLGSNAMLVRAQAPMKLTGSVTDEFSAPIGGAQVSFYSLDRICQTTSDVLGRFQLTNIPTGVYELEVAAPGFQTVTRPALNVTDLMRSDTGKKSSDLAVTMKIASNITPCGRFDSVVYDAKKASETTDLSGVVMARDGGSRVPIPNAQVFLFKMDLVMGAQRTNGQGDFQFKSILPGRYSVVIRHPDYKEQKSNLFWVARENTTHVTLEPVPLNKIAACQ
jgi:hypothetical protein